MIEKELVIEKRGHYEVIDFLKGFSIFTIVIMHLIQCYMNEIPSSIDKLASFGGSGVHVFIFCSGFGLYYSWLQNSIGNIEFLKRRFIKVYVPYAVVVCVSFIIPYIDSGENERLLPVYHGGFL